MNSMEVFWYLSQPMRVIYKLECVSICLISFILDFHLIIHFFSTENLYFFEKSFLHLFSHQNYWTCVLSIINYHNIKQPIITNIYSLLKIVKQNIILSSYIFTTLLSSIWQVILTFLSLYTFNNTDTVSADGIRLFLNYELSKIVRWSITLDSIYQ